MKNGNYILVKAPNEYPGYKYRNKYVYKHILIWWKHTGELPIPNKIIIHHKNDNRHDNRFRNLERITAGKHSYIHHKIDDVAINCAYCKKIKYMPSRRIKYRQKHYKNGICCSHSCSIKLQHRLNQLGNRNQILWRTRVGSRGLAVNQV